MTTLAAVAARLTPGRMVAAAVVLVAAIPFLTPNAYIQHVLIVTFLVSVLGSGWNIMAGYTGYISLGHSVFVGVGAYTAGILVGHWAVSPFLLAPLGGLAAAILALLLGVVTGRTRGAAFVIVSFAVLELLGVVTRNWASVTGGSQGLAMPLPDWDIRFYNWPFYYALFALALASVGLTVAIRRSKFGLGLIAIRDDEDKAAGVGVLTPAYKGLAFVASSALVGTAGAVYGYYVSFLTVSAMFDIVLSVEVVLAVLIGGRGTVWGPVLGAFVLIPLTEVTNSSIGGADAGALRLLYFGGLLVFVAVLLPRGIIPTVQDWWDRRAKRGSASPTGARLEDVSLPEAPRSERLARLSATGEELLSVRDTTVRFSGLIALDGVTVSVPAGSVTALIGPNGSGKTTLFNVVDGTYSASRGDLLLGGRSLRRLGRSGRAHAGIGRTHQLPRLFGSLTVLENVVVVSDHFSLRALARSAVSGAEAARATELLEFVGMGDYVNVRATALSYGQRKLVELAQVLMLDPAVILLDEPAAGVNPTLRQRLGSLIRALNASGRTFVIVEHDMHFVLPLADRAVVLAHGQVIAAGDPRTVSADPAVQDAYLGDDFVLGPQPARTAT
jgi:ABC-type branched-subunit amino acid transport system ATPase component/ABC-type branched-subunit amino acid transport system permease subunit